jgi:hypothetical protein
VTSGADRRSNRGTRILRIVFAVLAVTSIGGICALYAWADQPSVRFARLNCHYDVIYKTSGPVDAVVLGTSRVQRGILGEELAVGLGLDPKHDAVVNIARGGRGPGELYQLLTALDSERGLAGPIIVEYTPMTEIGRRVPGGWVIAPRYYQYNPILDNMPLALLGEDWQSKPREPAYSRLRDTLWQLQNRLDMGLEAVLDGTADGNRPVPAAERAAPHMQTCIAGEKQRRDQKWQMAAIVRRYDRELGPNRTWHDVPPVAYSFDEIDQDRQNYFLKKVIQLGKERGVPVYVVVMPGYPLAGASPEMFTAFEDRFGVPLLYPPASVLDQIDDPTLFQDKMHLMGDGAKIYTKWLASEIVRLNGGG